MRRLKNNSFARIGRKYFDEIKKIDCTTGIKDVTKVLSILDKISIPENIRVGVELTGNAIGGISFFFMCPKDDKYYERRQCKQYLVEDMYVTPTAMGAWQAYLFQQSSAVMPTYLYGGYVRRDFIFSIARLKDIAKNNDFNDESVSMELEKVPEEDLLPSAMFHNNLAAVSCCYWTSFGGLIRETAIMRFKGNRIKFLKSQEEMLVRYERENRY